MPRTTDQISTTVEREAFVLALPEQFDIKPDHVIGLPRKWQAFVYISKPGGPMTDQYERVKLDQNGLPVIETREYYRVRIITPKGKRSRNFHQFGSYEPIAVMEFVQEAVDKLTIKAVEAKRIRREEGNLEDEE
jgi:hypothetical protein